jgi:MFS family permease
VTTSSEPGYVARVARLAFGDSAAILGDTQFRLLLAAELMIVLGASLVSPLLETLTGVYGVSPGTVGLMVTAVTAPAAVVTPVAGSLADWYGRRPVLITGLTLFGTGGLALAFTTDFRVVLVLRGVQGLGFAFTLPTLITTIRDMYSGQREATGQGLRNATGGVANAVFPAVAGALVVVAWQLPFLLYALAVPVAAGLYRWFNESDDRSTDGAEGTESAPGSSTGDGDSLEYVRRVLDVTTRRHVAAMLVARTLFTVVIYAFLTYNSLLVARVFGGTPALAAVLVSLWAGTYSVVSTQTGRITGRWGHVGPLVLLNAGLGVGLVLVAVGPTVHVAGVGVLCIGVGVGLGGALYRSLVSGFAPKELRGGVVGVGEVLGRLGATATPVGLGLVVSGLEPDLGTTLALQWAVGGTGVAVTVVGLGCVLVYYLTAPADGTLTGP